jgi:hypothetical protein
MPTTQPQPSTLRRRLAALRPGRPTAVTCTLAVLLATNPLG